jgi:glutathione S-transferase
VPTPRLWSWSLSPFAGKVRIAFAEKGVDVELAPTFADLAAIPLAVRLSTWKPELAPDPDSFPAVRAWCARLRARPSAAEVDRRGSAA